LRKKKIAAGMEPAYLAHKIKSSISGIKLNLDYLKDSLTLSGDKEKSFNLLQREVERIQDLIKDVLMTSKKDRIEEAEVNLNLLLEKIREFHHPTLLRNNIRFINKVGSFIVEGIENDLHTMFLQLIENSIESINHNGSIEFYSEIINNELKVFVKDTGKGTEHGEKIFKNCFTTKETGAGLGLAIAKKVMDNHCGSIKLESSKPGETIFSVSFRNFRNTNE